MMSELTVWIVLIVCVISVISIVVSIANLVMMRKRIVDIRKRVDKLEDYTSKNALLKNVLDGIVYAGTKYGE